MSRDERARAPSDVSVPGHDLKLDEGVGTCGKAGQSVPVGVGLPTILVSLIAVGGTER